jgi:DNA-binding MarR family transcriptional regulator
MRLEERGLLSRAVCDVDRRGIYTNVTRKGRTLLEAARPIADQALRKALDDAKLDPQLRPLVIALEKAGFPD